MVDLDLEETGHSRKDSTMEIVLHEKSDKTKRSRDEDILTIEEDSMNSSKPKQVKLTNSVEKPPSPSVFKSPIRKSPNQNKENNNILKIFETIRNSPISNQKSPINSEKSPVQKEKQKNSDRLCFFQTKIGTSHEETNKNTNLNDSFARRIDLHMCNRESATLDTPPQVAKKQTKQTDDELVELGLVTQNNANESLSLSNSIQDQSTIRESTRLSESELIPKEKPQPGEELSQITPSLKDHMQKRKVKVLKFDLDQINKYHKQMIERTEEDENKNEKQEQEKVF